MLIAVQGCLHGRLDDVYEVIRGLQGPPHFLPIQLLLQCGDFQAFRDGRDLVRSNIKEKYRDLGQFHPYWTGEKQAPCLTVFVGGNHECPDVADQLYYGGFVAPRIFYLGQAGIWRVGRRFTVAGISGIYKPYTFRQPEQPGSWHVRQKHTDLLRRYPNPIDIVLTHDWPAGMHQFSNQWLKPHLFQERQSLGCPAFASLLHEKRPSFWFAAHHHTKFAAAIPHPDGLCTRFLALDKVLAGRDFLQILEIADPSDGAPFDEQVIEADPVWMALLSEDSNSRTGRISRATATMNHPGILSVSSPSLPETAAARVMPMPAVADVSAESAGHGGSGRSQRLLAQSAHLAAVFGLPFPPLCDTAATMTVATPSAICAGRGNMR